jgi:hypothetical protein
VCFLAHHFSESAKLRMSLFIWQMTVLSSRFNAGSVRTQNTEKCIRVPKMLADGPAREMPFFPGPALAARSALTDRITPSLLEALGSFLILITNPTTHSKPPF